MNKKLIYLLTILTLALLIAARDLATDFLLDDETRKPSTPGFLFFCFSGCVLLAWISASVRRRRPIGISLFFRLSSEQRMEFVKLGISTWGIYFLTVTGIKHLHVNNFNVVDWGATPLATILLAKHFDKEPTKARHFAGLMLLAVGLAVFQLSLSMPQGQKTLESPASKLWLWAAVGSAILTTASNGYQRRQTNHATNPIPNAELLYMRFIIPAIGSLIWAIATDPSAVFVGGMRFAVRESIIVVSWFLPLWLLCVVLKRDTIKRFATYVFLIPIFSIVFSPLVPEHPALMEVLSWNAVIGATLMIGGLLISEGIIRRPQKLHKQALIG